MLSGLCQILPAGCPAWSVIWSCSPNLHRFVSRAPPLAASLHWRFAPSSETWRAPSWAVPQVSWRQPRLARAGRLVGARSDAPISDHGGCSAQVFLSPASFAKFFCRQCVGHFLCGWHCCQGRRSPNNSQKGCATFERGCALGQCVRVTVSTSLAHLHGMLDLQLNF